MRTHLAEIGKTNFLACSRDTEVPNSVLYFCQTLKCLYDCITFIFIIFFFFFLILLTLKCLYDCIRFIFLVDPTSTFRFLIKFNHLNDLFLNCALHSSEISRAISYILSNQKNEELKTSWLEVY
jgi:hypothetical protein